MFGELGVGVRPTDLAEVVKLAKSAEACGFHSFWLSEGYHSRSALVTAAGVALRTSTIKMGLAILSPHTKHPALMAMEAATLDEVSGGRLILGIGRVINALTKHGFPDSRAIDTFRESILILRGLLGTGNFAFEGKVFRIPPPGSCLTFAPKRRSIPIYLGATGRRMLELAGELADGVVFNYPCSPSFVKSATPHLRTGLKRSGRELAEFDVAAYIPLSVDQDSRRAIRAAKPFATSFLTSRHPLMLKHCGITDEEVRSVDKTIAKMGLEHACREIDDELTLRMAIAGSPRECLERLQEYLDTGLNHPIIWEIIGPDREASLGLIGDTILPRIVSRRH